MILFSTTPTTSSIFPDSEKPLDSLKKPETNQLTKFNREFSTLIKNLKKEETTAKIYRKIQTIEKKLYGLGQPGGRLGSNENTQISIKDDSGKTTTNMNKIETPSGQVYIASPYIGKSDTGIEKIKKVLKNLNVNIVINLCEEEEIQKLCEKEEYFHYLDYLEIEEFDECYTKYKIPPETPEEKPIWIYHYQWKDGSITNPDNITNFAIDLFEEFREIKLKQKENPILVHCKAGVGRTGTFILIHETMKRIEDCINYERPFSEAFAEPNQLAKQLYEYRVQRGDDRFVQTKKQWKLACCCIRKYLIDSREELEDNIANNQKLKSSSESPPPAKKPRHRRHSV